MQQFVSTEMTDAFHEEAKTVKAVANQLQAAPSWCARESVKQANMLPSPEKEKGGM